MTAKVPPALGIACGAALLLVTSLFLIRDALDERQNRVDLLAHGRDTQARVTQSAGPESVLIEWTDETGKQLRAESRTGKPFARTHVGRMVAIKYDPDGLIREPLILSEASERERVNTFWIQSSIVVSIGAATICAVATFVALRLGFPRIDACRRSP